MDQMKNVLREVIKSEISGILGKVLDRLDSIDSRLERVEDQQKDLLSQKKPSSPVTSGSGERKASDAAEEAKGEGSNQISLHFIYKHKKFAILSFPPSSTVETVNETVRLEMEEQDQAYTFPAVQISSTRPKDGVHAAEHPSDKTLEELGIKNNQLIFVRALRLPNTSSRSISQRKSGSRKSSAGRALDGTPLSPRGSRSPKTRRSRASEKLSRSNVLAKSFHLGEAPQPQSGPAPVRPRVRSFKTSSGPENLPTVKKESPAPPAGDSPPKIEAAPVATAEKDAKEALHVTPTPKAETSTASVPKDSARAASPAQAAPLIVYYCTLARMPLPGVTSTAVAGDKNVVTVSASQKRKEEILKRKKEELRKREAELLRKLEMKRKREEAERQRKRLEAEAGEAKRAQEEAAKEEAAKEEAAKEEAAKEEAAKEEAAEVEAAEVEAAKREMAEEDVSNEDVSKEVPSSAASGHEESSERREEAKAEPQPGQNGSEVAPEEEGREAEIQDTTETPETPGIEVEDLDAPDRSVESDGDVLVAEEHRLRSVSDVALPARPAPVPQRLSPAMNVKRGSSAPRIAPSTAKKSPEREMLEQAVAELSEAADRVSEGFDVTGVLRGTLTKDGRMMSVLHDNDLERFKAMQLGKSQLDALADLTQFTDNRNRAQTESPAMLSPSREPASDGSGASKAKSLRGHPEMAAIAKRESNAATISSSSPELTRARKKSGPVGSIDNDIKRERSQRQSRVLVHQTSRMRDLCASAEEIRGGGARSPPLSTTPREEETDAKPHPSPREAENSSRSIAESKNKRKSKMLPLPSPQISKMNKKSKAQASSSMEQARDKLKALRKKKKAKKSKLPEEETEEDRRIAEKVKQARAKRKARLSHYQGKPQGRRNDLNLDIRASEDSADASKRPLSDRPSRRTKALSLASKPLRQAGDDITLTRKSRAHANEGNDLVRSPRKERESGGESGGKTLAVETRSAPASNSIDESEEEDTRSAASLSSKAVSSAEEEEETDDDYDCDDSSYDESDDDSLEDEDDFDDEDDSVRKEMQEVILKAKQSVQHS